MTLLDELSNHYYMTGTTDTDQLIARTIAYIEALEAHLRRADDIEHSISSEDWYKQRDALLAQSQRT
jgi:hypothetical protein